MRQKLYCLLSVFAVLLLAACMCAGPAAADDAEDFVPVLPYADGRLIIQCEISSDGLSVAESVTVLTDYRDLVPGMMLIETPEGMTVPEAVVYYRNTPGVILAEPDYLNQLPPDDPVVSESPSLAVSAISGTPATNDPYLSQQWGLETIYAFDAWKIHTGSSNVVVAVIDTGIKYDHEDLAANMWTNNSGDYGYDFVNKDDDPMDDNGHGTHCAGIIGAVGNNGVGVSGVAWNVSLMALKVLDDEGSGYDSDIIKAITYAKNNGADIISMSLGGYGGGTTSTLKTAIEKAGLLTVCAAGNENRNTDSIPHYPSAYDSVNILAVAATDSSDSLAYYSNYGNVSVDVACPGSGIYSTYYDGSYASMSGTSMATPMVAGIAALILSTNSTMSAAEVKEVLMSTVDPYSSLSGKVVTGGIVNASRALNLVAVHTVAVTSTTGGNASASPLSAAAGTLITLTATPSPDYKFNEWQVLSGGVTIVNNQFTMPACDVEIKAVFEEILFSANKSAAIVNQTIPAALPTLTVPLFTNPKSGKSIPLNDSVVVKAVIGGTEQTLPAKIIDGTVVLDDPESTAGADNLTVEFIGRKLGDSDGDGNVTVNDAVKVAQSLVKIVIMDEKGGFYGDADSDGNITVNDAVKVAQRLVGLVDENYE